MESVYSEPLRKAKRQSEQKAYASGLSTLTLSGVVFLSGGGVVLAGMSALNLANSVLSNVMSNTQSKAVLLEHAPEVLRWWQVFAKAFHVQVHESRSYLVRYFDGLSKRDADIFKRLRQTTGNEVSERVRLQLQRQILLESEQRFQPLWETGQQIEQDVTELLEEIGYSGATAIANVLVSDRGDAMTA